MTAAPLFGIRTTECKLQRASSVSLGWSLVEDCRLEVTEHRAVESLAAIAYGNLVTLKRKIKISAALVYREKNSPQFDLSEFRMANDNENNLSRDVSEL